MELKDFIGKRVINTVTKRHFFLEEITSPEIGVVSVQPNQFGHYEHYCFPTINGDPFKNGTLVFVDESLAEPFRQAYDAYCHTKDAYWEEYGYWMMRD